MLKKIIKAIISTTALYIFAFVYVYYNDGYGPDHNAWWEALFALIITEFIMLAIFLKDKKKKNKNKDDKKVNDNKKE